MSWIGPQKLSAAIVDKKDPECPELLGWTVKLKGIKKTQNVRNWPPAPLRVYRVDDIQDIFYPQIGRRRGVLDIKDIFYLQLGGDERPLFGPFLYTIEPSTFSRIPFKPPSENSQLPSYELHPLTPLPLFVSYLPNTISTPVFQQSITRSCTFSLVKSRLSAKNTSKWPLTKNIYIYYILLQSQPRNLTVRPLPTQYVPNHFLYSYTLGELNQKSSEQIAFLYVYPL